MKHVPSGGPTHPDDHAEILRDQDEANFNYYMKLQARWLEGRSVSILAMLWRRRGRNGKGVPEKAVGGVMGDYYVPVKSTIFHADKRNENENNEADAFRNSARLVFGNECGEEPWRNAVFKNKCNTDPVVARGCGAADTRAICQSN